jgi:hypothetical protein
MVERLVGKAGHKMVIVHLDESSLRTGPAEDAVGLMEEQPPDVEPD